MVDHFFVSVLFFLLPAVALLSEGFAAVFEWGLFLLSSFLEKLSINVKGLFSFGVLMVRLLLPNFAWKTMLLKCCCLSF